MAVDGRTRNALSKAIALGGAQKVQRVRYGLYRVPSATDASAVYTVTVSPHGQYRCTCHAGIAGNPCHHAASVYLAKIENASGGRVTRPAERNN